MKLLTHIGNVVFGLCTGLLLVSGLIWAVKLPEDISVEVLSLFVPVFMLGSFLGFLHRWWREGELVNFHLLVLLSSTLLMGSFYQFGGSEEAEVPGDLGFSVLSYNSRNFNMNGELPIKGADSLVLDFLRSGDSDIICLQECHFSMKRSRELEEQYPYRFVDFIYSHTIRTDHVIHGIFSRHPIVRKRVIDFPGSSNRAVYVDILHGGDTLRVFSVHLQSFKIVPGRELLESESYENLLKRMGRSIRLQNEQAELVREHIEQSPYPTIVTGDFNNTQFSRVYKTMKGGFSDSFREAGSGFGKTFDLFGFPMRIDYILADDSFEFRAHKNFPIELSDHYPIRAVLQKKGE